MKKSKYDEFMIEEIMPSVCDALEKEDSLFYSRFEKTLHKNFYDDYDKGIASYILTERTIQYIIFRELCVEYKFFPEDLAYTNSNERIDLSFYKNVTDTGTFAEIGVEIKQVQFKKDGSLSLTSLNGIISDFDKIKRAGNKHKYILLLGLYRNSVLDLGYLKDSIYSEIDNRKFRKYDLNPIYQTSFPTSGYSDLQKYLLVLLKLNPKKN